MSFKAPKGAFSNIIAMENNKLLDEKQELDALIGKGIDFEVKDFDVVVKRRFLGLRKRYELIPVTRSYHIAEPTLGTLDRLSAEWIRIAIDDEALKANKDNSSLSKARTLAHAHSIRCAKIVAIAVLGSEYLIPVATKGGCVYKHDDEGLDKLTRLFAERIKPSELDRLSLMINAMSNLGGFLNSIRLFQTERTTMPLRIEENNRV